MLTHVLGLHANHSRLSLQTFLAFLLSAGELEIHIRPWKMVLSTPTPRRGYFVVPTQETDALLREAEALLRGHDEDCDGADLSTPKPKFLVPSDPPTSFPCEKSDYHDDRQVPALASGTIASNKPFQVDSPDGNVLGPLIQPHTDGNRHSSWAGKYWVRAGRRRWRSARRRGHACTFSRKHPNCRSS